MDEIIAFVLSHWTEWLFSGFCLVLSCGYKRMSDRLDAQKKHEDAISTGLVALMRNSIVTNYNRCADKGYCPIYQKEAVRRIYSAYHALGGDDVATGLYHKLLDMDEDGVPNAPPDTKKEAQHAPRRKKS